jgi:hypothetical protein
MIVLDLIVSVRAVLCCFPSRAGCVPSEARTAAERYRPAAGAKKVIKGVFVCVDQLAHHALGMQLRLFVCLDVVPSLTRMPVKAALGQAMGNERIFRLSRGRLERVLGWPFRPRSFRSPS